MSLALRSLPGIRSNLALDAGHTSIVEGADHRVLVTPACPDYWGGTGMSVRRIPIAAVVATGLAESASAAPAADVPR